MMLRNAIHSAMAFALLSACSESGPTAPAPIASVLVTSPSPTVKAGKTILLVAQARDAAGNILSGRQFTWATSNGGVATVSEGSVTAISAGNVVITATSEGKSSELPLVVARASIASIAVSVTPSQLTIGQTVQAGTTVTDSTSKPVTDAVLSWSSNDETVAKVSVNGVVTGISVGTARIDARAEGILGSGTVTVIRVPVASVAVTLSPTTMLVGQSGQATAVVKDAQGNPLSGRDVTWTSSDANVASITGTGAISAKAAGTIQITASSEGKSGTSTLTVSAPSALSITSIAPALLTPGAQATINGTGFSAVPLENVLTLDGIAATVITASATQLSVIVPSTLPCVPTHPADVRLASGGNTVTASQILRAGSPRSLTSGSSLVLTTAADIRCTELPAGSARYVVSIFSNSQTPTSITPFRFRGSVTSASPNAVLARNVAPTAFPVQSNRNVLSLEGSPSYGSDVAHLNILEQNRTLYPLVRAAFVAHRIRIAASRGGTITTDARSNAQLSFVPPVGSTRVFRIRQFAGGTSQVSSCNTYVDVSARLVYAGSRALVYEDVAAPLAGTMDSFFAKVGQEFDAVQYDIASANFGDPLVTDPFTDNDAHLNMVFSPKVTLNKVAGFVTGCDFSPRDSIQNASSNFGENFYAVVPTLAGAGYTGDTPDNWLRVIRSTVVHEVKHIASFGARLTNGATSFEESWLEEGTARHAEELWARKTLYNLPWKGNGTYASTVYCDVRPNFPQCLNSAYGALRIFGPLYDVLFAPEKSSLFGRTADGDFNFYASSWSFVRWALDRHATAESSFLRAITQAKALTGIANVSAAAGRSPDEMMGNWSLALYLDENPAFTANPDVTFPTWNLRSIYAGLAADYPSNFVPFPLRPQAQAMTDFALDHPGINGGGFAMFELSGTTVNGQTIGIVGAGGTSSVSSSVRISIARVQ